MAEASSFRNQNQKEENFTLDHEENFCVFNVLCVFISLVTILADLATVILVFAEYCKDGDVYWAIATLTFILIPNVLINAFSMRWYVIDKKTNLRRWITHGCLVGLLERYVLFLRKVFSCHNIENIKAQKLMTQRNDLNLLHFLYLFTGTIPQIILQSYAIITLERNYYTKVFALTASNASVVWGCSTYIYSLMGLTHEKSQWVSFMLRLLWHFGTLIARISGILLCTVIFGVWSLLPLGLHWIAMAIWIILQNTNFCPNKLEETLYNTVMGFVYCFCYINLREGHTRYRLMLYYTLMITQNFGSLFLYVLISDSERQRRPWSIAATICVIFGTIFGLCSMVLYYRYFHSKGPIPWKYASEDVELNNKITVFNSQTNNQKSTGLKHVRSFKSVHKENMENTEIRNDKSILAQTDNDNADKKFLLEHWIARSGTPTFTSAPVGNVSIDVSSIELYTVENTPHCNNVLNKTSKKVTVCSPTELNIKLSSLENLESSIDEITSNNLNIQKRRGICSSDELREELTNINIENSNNIYNKSVKIDHGSEISHDTDGSNKKTSSDSIDMDLDLSLSDINSSDINTFNENIVQKLCLSALKNIKGGNQDADIENIQRIALDILKEMYARKDRSKTKLRSLSSKQRDLDTPTELLSVHDYENICAVNIAREAWGLRSWNGYCDIESWLHDGSVVRDRRRDTLTSASTEISSCLSQELKSAILSAPSFSRKVPTYSNVFVKFDKSIQNDYANTTSCQTNEETFLAKPCIVDASKDPNHLEPIIEEIDDLGDIDPIYKKRLNSESSLVATIDEIRNATLTSSPRNLYHRAELWDSPQFNGSVKLESNLKRALWKEPCKFNPSNIMESLPEKENILNSQNSKFDINNKEFNILATSTSLDLDNPESVSIYNKNTRKRQKANVSGIRNQTKKNNCGLEPQIKDLSNKDIDFLWQLVSDNSLSNEELTSNRRTSSLQSLIQKDQHNASVSIPSPKVSNIKKNSKSRPRRKFSILRERFEPKSSFNSDEEVLYHYSENASFPVNANFLNIKNQFDLKDASSPSAQQQKLSKVVTDSSDSHMSKSIKEKRTLFMKQVLSPPKFNTKIRYKT